MPSQEAVHRDYSQIKKFKKKGDYIYEGWNFNSGNYLFTTDTK